MQHSPPTDPSSGKRSRKKPNPQPPETSCRRTLYPGTLTRGGNVIKSKSTAPFVFSLYTGSNGTSAELGTRHNSRDNLNVSPDVILLNMVWKLHLTTKMYHILSCHRSLRALSH